MKNCSRCKTEKGLESFAVYNGKPHCWCRQCQCEASKSYRLKNLEKCKATNAAWRIKNPMYSAESSKNWRKNTPEYKKKLREYSARKRREDKNFDFRKNLKRFYGLSIEQYESMYRSQNGVCAICSGLNVAGRRLAVDHNHKTGQIRGLLCNTCNTSLGTAKESVELLRSIIAYLERHEVLSEAGIR